MQPSKAADVRDLGDAITTEKAAIENPMAVWHESSDEHDRAMNAKMIETCEKQVEDINALRPVMSKNASLVELPFEELPSPLPETSSCGFHKLSWQRLTSCLICEAVALGALSLPKVFASLGMLPGIVVCLGTGLASVYTSLIVGEVKHNNPQITNFAEMGKLLFGNVGYRMVATMLVLLLVLTTGSHVLTGIIAFQSLSSHAICSFWFGIVSAVLLFVLGLPTTFHKMAILAYIDFASITLAVVITIVASAVESHNKPGGIFATEWHWIVPREQRSFLQSVIGMTNVALAYAYVQCLPSFMSEMRRPQDYRKAVWTMGTFQIVFYTLTGALIYGFKGQSVKAPALLNLEPTLQKVVFGIALPVIFISGSINSQTAARFIYDRIFPANSPHHFIDTREGKSVWIALCLAITIVAWVSAEVIPSFEAFLGLIAALFTACFTFTLPAMLYLHVLRYTAPRSKKSKVLYSETALNVAILLYGAFMFFVGSGEST
jgi:hypothetical protein